MSLDEVKAKTSSSQFILWMEYLDWDSNAFDKQNYYLAQIAAEVRRSYIAKGAKVKIEDFILDFKRKDETPRPLSEQQATDRMKKMFFAATGLTGGAKKGKGRAS